MLRAFVTWLLPLALAAAGLLAGWGADAFSVTALLLHAEPFLLVLAAWASLLALWSGKRSLAFAVAAGAVAAMVGVRLPFEVAPHAGVPPEWIGPVHRCAAALSPPPDEVRLLQWTLEGHEPVEEVRATVAAAKPGVAVLHGVADEAMVHAVLAEVGGESRFYPPEGGSPGLVIVAAGGFHPCGETLEWSDAMDTPYGYTLAFVGVPSSTVFPLLVTRLPGPLDGGSWTERMATASARVLEVVTGLQGASTVVVADAPAPSTFRNLDGRMASAGVASVSVPPSWPARWGRLPLVTLHPFDRMWVGPIWTNAQASRAHASTGVRAPVLTVLSGPALERSETPPVTSPPTAE